MKNLNLKIPPALIDATRLVRGGRLAEATAAIQRALRGKASSAEHAPHHHAGSQPIEGVCRVVDERAAMPSRNERAAPYDRRASQPPQPNAGKFVAGSYSGHAGTRGYKVYVPGVYHGQALPLVVMLHGCTQSPDDFAAGTRMNELAEELGFVVAYPAQASEANASKCWNWFQSQDQQRDRGEPSLIAGITREVLATYGLDAHRVYVAGLSAGGAMAAVMGTTYPDLYSAIGIHSGLAYAAATDVASAFAAMSGKGMLRRQGRARGRDPVPRMVPTIVFHGDNDTTVHPSNGEHAIAQAAMPRADSAQRNAPQQVERGSAGGREYTRTIHRDAEGKPVIEHWAVHGAGHAWSGGSRKGSYADPSGPDAAREMLRFFLEHTH